MKKTITSAFIKSLPVFAGYLFLGFGFGILLEKGGYGLVWALAMCVTIFGGSMQYVAVTLLTSHASLLTVAITTLLVNARYMFYGISMIEHYKGSGLMKPYLMFSITDETYSILCTGECPEGVDFHKYSFCLSLFNHIYWILGGALGVIAGTVIKFNSTGVEFAMTALFITVFLEQWKASKNHFSSLAGIAASVLCLLVFGGESFLIPSMILILMLLLAGKKFTGEEEAE